MKKILLSAMCLAAFTFAANAQNCVTGVQTTGFFDDYSSATEPASEDGTFGLFHWGEPDLTGDDNPNFQAVLNRNTTSGKLDVTVTQGYGEYVPFGISFGDGNLLNLSENASFSVTVTNHSTGSAADSTIRFRMLVQDEADNVLDTDAKFSNDNQPSNAWRFALEIAIAPGQTKTFTANTLNTGDPAVSLSGTYLGGYSAVYPGPVMNQNFDFTKVKSVLFTVTNNKQNAADGYKHMGLNNTKISIDDVKIGACVLGTKSASIASSKLYPNPASEIANIELALKSTSDVKVTVSDMMGKVVAEVANEKASDIAKSFDVSALTKGVYTVNYYINGSPAKAEMLVVK